MNKIDTDIKVSFIGDIMCEKPLLKAAQQENDTFNFDDVFVNMKNIFKESDYIVGNLETVCAGKEKKYTNHIYNFNTPDSFIESIAKSGIDMVTTANNHCLDRGIYGLKRTISILDQNNVEHIGTYKSPSEQEEVFTKSVNGIKISFLNYTYGTNLLVNKIILDNNEKHHVNLLKSQKDEIELLKKKEANKSVKSRLFKILFKIISVEKWIKIKKKLGMTHNKAYKDDEVYLDNEYLEKIKKDIQKAKESSDHVIVCMHSGGQFNEAPGKFTEYMMDFMKKNGVDTVIGTHPHVVQKHEMKDDMLAIYSLGNFNISPSSVYLIDDDLPDYGIMFHLYLKKDNNQVKVSKTSFSILKMHEDANGYVKTYPVDELIHHLNNKEEKEKLKDNVKRIYNKFAVNEKEKISIQREYELVN
ncbi:CapA family protein [Oceanobacillus jeddahense]|uniref:CapA family protein n=1 Tax=Oceanobacillus jeddahense TaxID=1462527 RepID=UPI0005960F72|nr:CapA family protein [Oceanobacillus jeddahense]